MFREERGRFAGSTHTRSAAGAGCLRGRSGPRAERLAGPLVYHRAMDQASQEIERLGERVEQILVTVRRLADENASLREQLTASRDANEQLRQRIAEARERVQAALARLPAPAQAAVEAEAQPQHATETANLAPDGDE